MCPRCGDVFQLRIQKMRKCECGFVKGRYLNNSEAEVSKDAISIAIGNGSIALSIALMEHLKRTTNNLAERGEYILKSGIEYAWVRPNEGPGNPHTKIINEKRTKK